MEFVKIRLHDTKGDNFTDMYSSFPALLQIQGKSLGTVKVTQQTQGAQTTARTQKRSPAQRRKSLNK